MDSIRILEKAAVTLEHDEHWEAVVTTYQEILKVDSTLSFAQDGLRQASDMVVLHQQLDKYIEEPDRLSVPSVMEKATRLVVEITIRSQVGPRLAGQRADLSRLLKRPSTPVTH